MNTRPAVRLARKIERGIITATQHCLGEIVKKVKIFAEYSIPLVWGIVGLVVGCVGAYFGLAFLWMHVIMRPEAITPTDGLTVMILSLICGVFIGSASLYASAQSHWQSAKHHG
jgi:hypothetical protein